MDKSYDFIIIGGGSSGLAAAEFAAELGLSVCLVEKSRIGGDCTWTGCIPSKALLKVGKVAHSAKDADQYGIKVSSTITDMVGVRDYVRDSIDTVYKHETPEKLSEKGIDVIIGAARFVDPHRIKAGNFTLTGKKFLIATGAGPYIPPIIGIDKVPFLTYETIFDNDVLAKHLIVIGAGPVGVEIAQAYRRLGSMVSIIDVDLLPDYDDEASKVLLSVFGREGIKFVPGMCLDAQMDGKNIVIGTSNKKIIGDMLLIAAGREPRFIDLDLEQAGVTYDDSGIEVDKYLRTSGRHIFAAGDVAGSAQFSHVAGWQGFVAARNALLPGKQNALRPILASAIFTDPEIAQAGFTEIEARKRFGQNVHVNRANMKKSDRAITEHSLDGFTKVIHKSNGTILGATIVSERAGETINEFVLAMEKGLKIDDLASTVHVYPSYGVDTMRLAGDISLDRYLSGLTGSIIRGVAHRYA
jgi:pyruvate/2-oxoglutarate dehydrogenase complex dihydrolipoamide dehydrogenase (E3) component